jgi:hypothetical protein
MSGKYSFRLQWFAVGKPPAAYRITGSLDFFPSLVFFGVEARRFGNWVCFRPQVKGAEDTYSVGPLERANRSH